VGGTSRRGRGRSVVPWKRRLVGVTFVLAFPIVLVLVADTHSWGGEVTVAFAMGGAVGLIVGVAMLWRDLYRFRPVSQRTRRRVAVTAIAVGVTSVALATSVQFGLLGVMLGVAVALGVSALVNLFDAPDPRRKVD
jgi:drug/metabolite transporter (DMT)-like permease